MPLVDFKQIQYFVQVAELGSFTRAASVLRVAQPALSRQVRSLEVELRQPLFDRNGRGVTLTEAGRRLLAHGRGILQQLERARLDLEDQRGAASGLLSIGLPHSRPHAIRMRLETVLAEAGLKPRVGLEIESVPAILDLVQRHPLHAVLSLNAIRGSGCERALRARPIRIAPGQPPLATGLWIATSAQRPRGPLLEQAVPLLAQLMCTRLAMANSFEGPAGP